MEVHWLEDFLALVPVSVADNHGHPVLPCRAARNIPPHKNRSNGVAFWGVNNNNYH